MKSQLGVHQRRGRHTPEWRRTYPLTTDPVVSHSHQSQLTEARLEHRLKPRPVAREHAPRSSAHDARADRYHSRHKTERLSDRAESPLSGSRLPSTGVPPCDGDCSISSFVFGGEGGMPQQWKDAIILVLHTKKEWAMRQVHWHLADNARRQDTVEHH